MPRIDSGNLSDTNGWAETASTNVPGTVPLPLPDGTPELIYRLHVR